MAKRKIPKRNYECAICDSEIAVTHFHHIQERANNGPSVAYNLIELCPNCHYLHHDGKINILEIVFSTDGYLLHYVKDGQEHYKPIKRNLRLNE